MAESIEKLAAAFQQNPAALAAEYGWALVSAGRAKDAVKQLSALHQKQALKGRARTALAQAYFDVFRLDDAAALLGEKVDANDAQAARLTGEIALERGQTELALETLRRAAQLDPNDRKTAELMSQLGAGDDGHMTGVSKGTAALNRTLRRGAVTLILLLGVVAFYDWRVKKADALQALVQKAKAEKQKDDYVSLLAARNVYGEALAEDASNPASLGGLAEVDALLLVEHGMPNALAPLRPAVTAAEEQNVNSGERFFAEAIADIAGGHPDTASAMLESTLAKGGVDAKVFYALGEAQKASGKFTAAKESFRRAYELDPYQPAIACELGDLYVIDGDIKNADFYYRKAADANPQHLRAAARALWTRLLFGEDVNAKVVALATLSDMGSPAHVAAYKGLVAQNEFLFGDKTKVLAAAQAAHAARPDDPALFWELAQLQLALAPKQGVETVTLLEQRFGHSPQLTMDKARAVLHLQKLDDALAVVRADKDFAATPRGLAFIARLQMSGSDNAAVLDTLSRAEKLGPQDPDVLYAKARLLQSQKQDAKAMEVYSQALLQRASFPEVYQQVANIYNDNKDSVSAQTNYVTAEKMYRQAAAPVFVLNSLYEDAARASEKSASKEAKSDAARWRAKIRK